MNHQGLMEHSLNALDATGAHLPESDMSKVILHYLCYSSCLGTSALLFCRFKSLLCMDPKLAQKQQCWLYMLINNIRLCSKLALSKTQRPTLDCERERENLLSFFLFIARHDPIHYLLLTYIYIFF